MSQPPKYTVGPELYAILQQVREETMVDVPRLDNLYEAVCYAINARLPGAFVECGVWKGGCSMLMALTAMARGDYARDIYLYDTFAGMTEPTSEDVKFSGLDAASTWREQQREDHNEWCYAPLEHVQQNMLKTGYDPSKLHFVKGPVEETIPGTMPDQIAVLRLDTDFYASTLHELEHLYPRLVPGGVIIFDDYNHWKGQRTAALEYFKKNGLALLLSGVTTSTVGIKPPSYAAETQQLEEMVAACSA